jgi:hypothetical protein
MEHRHFPRRAENFDVILQSKTGRTVDARVLDVSREGMRISMNGSPIPSGVVIDVIVPENKRELFGSRYLRGFVAYATRGTVGLWLVDVARKNDLNLANDA